MENTIFKNDQKFNLTEKQNEIIVGSMLGDANIHWSQDNWQSKFTKCQSIKDNSGQSKLTYMKWHWDSLMPFSNSVTQNDIRYQYATYSDSLFSNLEKIWYKRDENNIHILNEFGKRIKVIPNDIILTPLSVCIWFMDDGYLDAGNGNARFCTHGFTKNECQFLVERLEKDLGLKSHVILESRGYPMIFMGVKHYKILIDIIKPHVEWDCFHYKLDQSYSKIHQTGESHSQSKLTAVDVEEMIRLRSLGKSQAVIADIFKISRANVSLITNGQRWKHLTNHIDAKRRPIIKLEIKNKVIELHQSGLTKKSIAEKLGISRTSVSRVLAKLSNI